MNIKEFTVTDWNGFECLEFDFEGYPAKVIKPHKSTQFNSLILKTEYFNAFPETEIALLNEGFTLGFIKNKNRWGTREDIDRKAEFIRFVTSEFSLKKKCVPVGMSCGGIFAVKLASLYPELVACIYADAPVVNYMSCPCGFGKGNQLGGDNSEIMQALEFESVGELLAYRDMPLDHLEAMAANRIPVVLAAGDSDTTVPYDENGIFIKKLYEEKGLDIEVYVKPGCDHHPHGLEDPAPIVSFIKKHTEAI